MGRRLRGLRALFKRRTVDDEVRRELEFHIDMEVADRQRKGLGPAEARRTTLRDFGTAGRIRDEVHDVRGMTFWEALAQDLRFGLRMLRRSPGFSIAAIGILALGIGANTAMFSVINGVLLKPLPFENGHELVLVQQSIPQATQQATSVSIQEFQDYSGRMQTVRDLVEYHQMSFTLLNQGDPDRVSTGVVSANFFDMLGVQPTLGRSFVDRDDDLGAEAVLILSHEYWRQKFGGDEDVIGRVLEMNNRPHTVVGVLPQFPQYPRFNDVYMPTSACPFRAQAEEAPGGAGHRAFAALLVFGRLVSGGSLQQASSEAAAIARSFDDVYEADHQATGSVGLTASTASLQEELVDEARPMLYALLGVTALVLLIACANVANLTLARTIRRSRELAVRTALGAGRGRLVRQLLTESAIVALTGGALGLGLAWVSIDLLANFISMFTPRTGQIAMDGQVLLFAVAASVTTGLLFGIAPALSTRRGLSQAVREGSAASGDGVARQRVRAGLVVAQVAVSCVLLVGAALLLESLYRLATVPMGYETERVATAAIYGNFSSTQTPEQRNRIREGVLERLRASPGVRAAALTSSVPQTSIQPFPQSILVEQRGMVEPALEANPNSASDQYFETLGVPFFSGRDFRLADSPESLPVAIINQSMARFWDEQDPVGRRFAVAGQGEPAWMTVVGVVEDFQLYDVEHGIVGAQYYRPLAQINGFGGRLIVRTDASLSDVTPLMKDAVRAVDPTMPVEEVQTLATLRSGRLEAPAVTAGLLTIFAGVALVITLAGIAGVIGTAVSQRTREIGLRMALGAGRLSVLNLVVRQGVLLVCLGLVLGMAGSWAFARLLDSLLFSTTTTDPTAYAAVVVVFLLAAVLAAAGPVRRATGIDPLTALKAE